LVHRISKEKNIGISNPMEGTIDAFGLQETLEGKPQESFLSFNFCKKSERRNI